MADTAAHQQANFLAPSPWQFKNQAEREEWFEAHGEAIAQAHAQWVSATQALGAVIVATKANEHQGLTVADFTDCMIDSACGYYAEEVRDWLGC